MIPVMRPWLGEEEAAAAAAAVSSGWVAQGPRVAEFEAAFAAAIGAGHAVAVSSCTAALHLALMAAGIGLDDEVIVPSLSFIATANAVRYVGAVPRFADVDEATQNLTAATVEECLTDRTRAVILVDQAGVPADLDAMRALCMVRGITVVEDAACAVGSVYKGQPVGARADLAAFSFHPRKLLTTGEGGMLVTPDKEVAVRMRRLREHGMDVSAAQRHASRHPVTEHYTELGFNYRMTDVQAAIGLVQLRKLDRLVARRRSLAQRYQAMLEGIPGLRTITDPEYGTTNYQSFWVLLPDGFPVSRNELLLRLAEAGVSARRGIMAAHLEPAYADHSPPRLPVTERLTASSVILPLFHELTEKEQNMVVSVIRSAARLTSLDLHPPLQGIVLPKPHEATTGSERVSHADIKGTATMSNTSTHGSPGQDLVIVGAGGFGREAAQAVHDLNRCGGAWRLLGYLDDNPALHGTAIDGIMILGGLDDLRRFPDAAVVVCTGRPGDYVSRMRIVYHLSLPNERYATIVHPTAVVSASSSIGHGCVLLAHVVLTATVQIGHHVAIMPQVTLTHDDVIEDFATLASGVRLGGGVRVQRGAYLGAGALIRENRTIGAFSLVGMGAVVTSDVPARQVWVGVPARYLRVISVPGEPSLEETQLAVSSADICDAPEIPGQCGRRPGRLRRQLIRGRAVLGLYGRTVEGQLEVHGIASWLGSYTLRRAILRGWLIESLGVPRLQYFWFASPPSGLAELAAGAVNSYFGMAGERRHRGVESGLNSACRP